MKKHIVWIISALAAIIACITLLIKRKKQFSKGE